MRRETSEVSASCVRKKSNMTGALARTKIARKTVSTAHTGTERIALIDASGIILAVNQRWLDFAQEIGTALEQIGPGGNYLEMCRRSCFSNQHAREALTGIRAVLAEKLESFAMDYPAASPSG